MMSKGIRIGALIILVLAILGFVGYYLILPIINPAPPQTGSSAWGVTEAHFEVFPAGTQIQRGMTGTNTNIFNKDDLVSISGQANSTYLTTLTIKILDTNGSVMGTAWLGDKIKIQTGAFGFGSITIPQTAGNYILKIYLDDLEVKTLPFQVL